MSTPSRTRSSTGKVSTATISTVGSTAAMRSPSMLQTTAIRRPSISAKQKGSPIATDTSWRSSVERTESPISSTFGIGGSLLVRLRPVARVSQVSGPLDELRVRLAEGADLAPRGRGARLGAAGDDAATRNGRPRRPARDARADRPRAVHRRRGRPAAGRRRAARRVASLRLGRPQPRAGDPS